MTSERNATAPRRSAWIPWVFVGGMLTVFAVNTGLVYAALSTFTGVTVGRAYERGRGYDQVLAEAARQDALGWSARVTLAEDGMLVLVAQDRDGHPLAVAVRGVLHRPLEGIDLPLDFATAGAGRWIAAVQAPRAGQWEARLTLTGPGGQPFDVRERIFVR
jgi:nitrogen fixation protein FixH